MCKTQKKWWAGQHTLRYRNSTLIKKNCAGIGSISVSADTQNFWYRIGIGSEKVVSSPAGENGKSDMGRVTL